MYLFAACANKKTPQVNENKGLPQLAVQEEIHNFGTLEAGEIVTYSVKIENKGEGTLLIDSVLYSCGCLDITWTESPIAKGKSGFVSITYDSSGEWGNIFKTVEIYSNAPEKKKNVYIAAKVNNQLFNQK